MEITSHLYGQGSYTTRPIAAKKIDLDPMSKRTINPEYNNENSFNVKPRKILQPSNQINHNPLFPSTEPTTDSKVSIKPRPSTPKVNNESQQNNNFSQRRVLK